MAERYAQTYDMDFTNISYAQYNSLKYLLRVELLALQADVIENDRRICILTEGRDTAGKTSALKFMTKNLIPKHFIIIPSFIPTIDENNNWLTTWQDKLPKPGQIAFFDRSWYSRALIQPTMDYCTKEQYQNFLEQIDDFEQSLLDQNMEIIKLYFSISSNNQAIRLINRKHSPLKYWKYSDNDELLANKWELFTNYKIKLLNHTSQHKTPWTVIEANNKRSSRLKALHYLISTIDYANKSLLGDYAKASKHSYDIEIDGLTFSDLTLEQYELLCKLSGEKT
ncbi:MAG TPA: polyphosphate kinase [Coxiellaceae bacterium]|nr:polyphosphate kinase [Coxiellaceae bacterium]